MGYRITSLLLCLVSWAAMQQHSPKLSVALCIILAAIFWVTADILKAINTPTGDK